MRKLLVLVGFLLCGSPTLGQEGPPFVGGDIVFWIPWGEGSQVLRNEEYFSVSLHGLYMYYRSGYFANIRTVVIQSDVKLDQHRRPIIGSMVNAMREKSRGGEFIGLNDHLAVLVPATPARVQYQVSFKGVGEDRFKPVFEMLSGSEFKVALGLGDATLGTISAIGKIIRKLTATPYTRESPKGILQIGHSLVLYAAANQNPDALRAGFYAVISARENSNDDLDFLLNQDEPSLSVRHRALYFRNEEGNLIPFRRNSYVILAVTSVPRRGEDQNSSWFQKYSDARRVAHRSIGGNRSPEDVWDEAVELWRKGNTLLQADSNYIEAERREIEAKKWGEIEESFRLAAHQELHPSDARELQALFDDPRGPGDAEGKAAEYFRLLAERPPESAGLSVFVADSKGSPLPGADVSLEGVKGISAARSTDSMGMAVFPDILAGRYSIHVVRDGFSETIRPTSIEPYRINTTVIRLYNGN